MRVTLMPPQPSWKDAFAREASVIQSVLGNAVLKIHHIGSTSIPGIAAKPVIDMLAECVDVTALDEHTQVMESQGYVCLFEYGIPGRRFFQKTNSIGERTHHIHAFSAGGDGVIRHLAFRDHMRSNPKEALIYEALKARLVVETKGDPHRYHDGKDAYIKRIEALAVAEMLASRT